MLSSTTGESAPYSLTQAQHPFLGLGRCLFRPLQVFHCLDNQNISEIPLSSCKKVCDLVLHDIVCTAKAPTTLLQNLANRIDRNLVANLLVDDGIE